MTALRWAAEGGHTATVALLLDRGAGIDNRSPDGWTALMCAVNHGDETAAVSLLLLNRGADFDAVDYGGFTAIYLAGRKWRSRGNGKTAALLAFFGAKASANERRESPLLASLHGWCRLQIAATFRLHGLARRALRSGAIARDPPTLAVAAAILAAARSSNTGVHASGLPARGLPVCAETARLARAAVSGWSPVRHWLYHGGFRATVETLLLVRERKWRLAAGPASEAVEGASVPCLPVELWFLMCRHLRRDDFACSSLLDLGDLDDTMRPRPWL